MMRQVGIAVLSICFVAFAVGLAFSQNFDGKVEDSETFDMFSGKAKCLPCGLPAGGAVDLEINVASGSGVNLYVFDETNFINYQKGNSQEAAISREGTVKGKVSSVLKKGNWYIVVCPLKASNSGNNGLIQIIEFIRDVKNMPEKVVLSVLKNQGKSDSASSIPVSRVELKWAWKFDVKETTAAKAIHKDSVDFSGTFQIEARQEAKHLCKISDDLVPGYLVGKWLSSGKSAGIKGANDDTLVRFQLIDPDGKVIKTLDHPKSGDIKERITAPGTYTLVFCNSGIVRSSARNVNLKAAYNPD